MTLTRAEAAMLGRRREQPVRRSGDLLAVWVPGKLKNPLNGAQWGKSAMAKARYRVEWKERVALALLEAHAGGRRRSVDPIKLRIAFEARTHNRLDGDGLQAACKPIRDALVECGVVSGDAERDGHRWEYSQVIDRARRGVEIRISLLAGDPKGVA